MPAEFAIGFVVLLLICVLGMAIYVGRKLERNESKIDSNDQHLEALEKALIDLKKKILLIIYPAPDWIELNIFSTQLPL